MKSSLPILMACMAATAVIAQVAIESSKSREPEVVKASKVPWAALNPARGDKGPKAGALWNDRTKESASGFLVRFSDGFSSPPHIHNVTYRGVVLSGLIHNDDPEAEEMWMPPGSFWTQPAGEVHITAAKGQDAMAYIEIDEGPYLVLPKEEAFDKGERPVNVDPSNLVWLSRSETSWVEGVGKDSPEIAFLWGKPAAEEKSGSFLRLPKGYDGKLTSKEGTLRVVMVKGGVTISDDSGKQQSLVVGEFFSVAGKESVRISTEEEGGATVYLQAQGSYLMSEVK
ncbi:MAG: DUF4437 domain-containing protein [Akkermansiaceae bacterium]